MTEGLPSQEVLFLVG